MHRRAILIVLFVKHDTWNEECGYGYFLRIKWNVELYVFPIHKIDISTQHMTVTHNNHKNSSRGLVNVSPETCYLI